MRKAATVGLLVASGVIVSVAIGVRVQHEERAAELLRRSERLLHPSLSLGGSLGELRAREARELIEEAQALAPDRAGSALLLEARVLERLQRAHVDQASALLVAVSEPERDEQWLRLSAQVALERKDALAAQAFLQKLPSEAQDDPRTLLLRSDVSRALGRSDEALQSAQRALELEPKSAALYERRGLAREMLGELSAARGDLAHAVELDSRGSSALFALGRLLRSVGELQGALLAFQEVTQRNPEDAEAWLASGVCRAGMGDRVSARVELERAAALAETRAEPLLALADLDVEEGALPAALQRYRAAALLDKANPVAQLKLGNALLRSGSVADAVKAYRAALQERPDLAAAHNGLGAALIAMGDLQGAEDTLKTAARLDPADAHPWLNLARVYKRRGDNASLADALARAEDREHGNPTVTP
jgi:tetratricopeptide (TPR) repeat protein